MKRREKIKIEPGVFRWLLKTSGYTLEELSKKTKISLNTLKLVNAREEGLTFGKIKNLSKVFHRPTAAFLLSEPPEEPPLPRDFEHLLLWDFDFFSVVCSGHRSSIETI